MGVFFPPHQFFQFMSLCRLRNIVSKSVLCSRGGDLAASRCKGCRHASVMLGGGTKKKEAPDLGELPNCHECFYSYLGHLLSFIGCFSGLSLSYYKVPITNNNLLKNYIIYYYYFFYFIKNKARQILLWKHVLYHAGCCRLLSPVSC